MVIGNGAIAQDARRTAASTQLPEITVTAPSPIVRQQAGSVANAGARRPRRSRAAIASGRRPQPAPCRGSPQQGVLPIVTDQFATVTVVPNEEIRRSGGATLGDLLFSKPGITGSSFAPGASSRPIIRGLDVNRVGIVENGIAAGGASDLGEDHFVPIDPLATNQVEVMRGPAALALRIDLDRRRRQRHQQPNSGCDADLRGPRRSRATDCRPRRRWRRANAGCVNVETRTAVSSVDRGVEGGILLDAGGSNVAVHADAYGRKSGDYSIPSYPYLFDQTRPVNGRQPNSAAQADGASIGGSYIFHGGFIGAAITQNNALYHIPGIDGADHQTRIDAHQTKFTAKGEYRPDAAAIDAIRFWAGATDYKHNEIGLADLADPSTRRRAADLHQQGAGRPRRGADDAVQRALCHRHHRVRLAGRASGTDRAEPRQSRHVCSTGCGIRTTTPASPATSSTNSNSPKRPRPRSPAASSMSICTASTPDFPADFLPDGNPQSATRAQSVLHAEERQHRPDPESARRSRRQHHRAICRARAEAGRIVLARRA